MTDRARILAELRDGLATGASLLALTDYDGTLTPLVVNPAEARLPPEVRDVLCMLARSPRIRVGILSGRRLSDLRARVGVPGLIYGGSHGLEVEMPGLSFRHPEAEAQRPTLRAVARTLALRAHRLPGVRVEPKTFSVAVHYRNAAPASVPRLTAEIARTIREYPARLRTLHGKKVIEILPRVRWNKGECALWIRDQVVTDGVTTVRMLYMGDDRTDELAFEVLTGKALTVRVGSDRARTAAAYRLARVSDVHRLLSALAGEVGTP